MDTPEKARIGSPIAHFEESPFSNFINSLSPIKPSKTIRISQTFGSISFSSPPSVFTSPQINLQRESRFVKRDQLPELAKPESSSDNENKEVRNKDAAKSNDWPSNSTNEVKELKPSKDEGSSVDAPCEASNHALELPRELKYDSGNSSCQTAPSFGCEIKTEPGTSSCAPLFQESSTRDSFGTQLSTVETEKNMDGSRCDWDSLIFDASDLLVFESPQAQLQDQPEKSGDEHIDIIASLLSNFPEDDVNDLEPQHGLGSLTSDVLLQSKDQVIQLAQANKLKQIYQGQDNHGSSTSNGSFTGQTSKVLENKPILHRGIRRRCLVFEIPGAKKNVNDGSTSTTSSLEEANTLSNSKQLATMQGGDSPMSIRPGIGLHLNALAVTPLGHRVLKLENLSSEQQLIPVPGSSEHFPSPATQSEKFQSSASSQDFGNVENEVQNAENASAYEVHDDVNPSSPKKKRRRPENSGEGEACKRCNCKKSKCLKLYCECFAAGVYCVEPCACQDCFNKPIHEETVLATRKQIESRNPLAFAPKVIRSLDSVNDFVDDSNRTPASARHKRGCNCKKSNCLKKYCECYQGGVGCSIGCRCEGCKNTFGRKDGSTGMEMDLDVEEDTRAHENSTSDNNLVQHELHEIHNDEELNPAPVLPKTPLGLFRSPMPLPSGLKGKPPRFGGINSCSLLNRDGTGRSTFLRPQHKTDKLLHNSEELPAVLHNTSPSSSIKTLSPNSKRITPPIHSDSRGQSPGLRSSRKLILQSIPSFPSLTPRN